MIRWLLVAVLSSGLLASFVASATTFKIATISIDGSGWMKAMRAAAADVDEATQGRVKFKFYPGGVMGDDTTVLRRIRLGQLHGAALTAGSLTSAYTDVQLYNLPMVFRDLDEVDYVRERLDSHLRRGLSANGYEALGFAAVGFAYPMSSVQATSIADVRGLKVWVPAGDPGTQRTAEAFGIAPIPLTNGDVFAGLQTGLINAVTAPPILAVALQWHTQLDYVLDLPLLYVFGTMVLSNSSFSKLSAADQETVRRLVGAALAGIDAQSRADHESALAALQQQGLVLTHPGADEFSEWQSSADAGTARMLETGVVTQTGYDTLNTYLLEYRNGTEVSAQ